MIETLSGWIDTALAWLVHQVEVFGYTGIFVMMFLESTFCPFPSEVAMIPAGFLAAQGKMDFTLAVLAGILGSLLGAYFNYYLARVVGIPVLRRYGKYVFFDESKLDRCNEIFRRHGEITTFVCRLIPLVRQYISLPAGLAGMRLGRFGFYTGLGAGIWMVILTAFGYAIGEVDTNPDWSSIKEQWQQHKPTIYAVMGGALVVLIGVYAVLKRRKGKPGSGHSAPAD